MRYRGIAQSAVLLAIAATPLAAQYDEPAWTFSAGDSIRRSQLTALGTIAVLTSSAQLHILDPQSGKPLWSRPRSRLVWFLPQTRYAMVTDSGSHLVDLATGATRWSLRDIPVPAPHQFVVMAGHGQILVYGASGGSVVVAAIGLDSGNVRWRRDDWFPDSGRVRAARVKLDLQVPDWDSDTTCILWPSAGGAMRVDTRSGAVLWRIGLNALTTGSLNALTAGGWVFVQYGPRLIALEQSTGSVVWEHGKAYQGSIQQMALTAAGLVVRGELGRDRRGRRSHAFLEMLDPTTGASRWVVTSLSEATPFIASDDTAYIAARRKLLAVHLGTGLVRDVLDVRFKGSEHAALLEARDNGFLLLSAQSLMAVDAAGQVRFHTYHPPLGDNLLEAFAEGFVSGLVTMPVDPYTRFPRAHHEAGEYHVVFTGQGAGYSFVRVAKRDGRDAGRVWLDRIPASFFLDAAGSMVFVRRRDEVVAFRF